MYILNRFETNCGKSMIPLHVIWSLCWYNFPLEAKCISKIWFVLFWRAQLKLGSSTLAKKYYHFYLSSWGARRETRPETYPQDKLPCSGTSNKATPIYQWIRSRHLHWHMHIAWVKPWRGGSWVGKRQNILTLQGFNQHKDASGWGHDSASIWRIQAGH